MTDREKVYTKVVKTLKETMKMDHQGHLVTLAMMITGIVTLQSVPATNIR